MNSNIFEQKLKEKQHNEANKFPDGKISDDDEGEVSFAIGTDPEHKAVVIMFKNPIKWLGLPKEETLKFAELLVEKANEL